MGVAGQPRSVCWGWPRRNAAVFGLAADARVLMMASPTFDASIFDFFCGRSGRGWAVWWRRAGVCGSLTALLQRQQVSARC